MWSSSNWLLWDMFANGGPLGYLGWQCYVWCLNLWIGLSVMVILLLDSYIPMPMIIGIIFAIWCFVSLGHLSWRLLVVSLFGLVSLCAIWIIFLCSFCLPFLDGCGAVCLVYLWLPVLAASDCWYLCLDLLQSCWTVWGLLAGFVLYWDWIDMAVWFLLVYGLISGISEWSGVLVSLMVSVWHSWLVGSLVWSYVWCVIFLPLWLSVGLVVFGLFTGGLLEFCVVAGVILYYLVSGLWFDWTLSPFLLSALCPVLAFFVFSGWLSFPCLWTCVFDCLFFGLVVVDMEILLSLLDGGAIPGLSDGLFPDLSLLFLHGLSGSVDSGYWISCYCLWYGIWNTWSCLLCPIDLWNSFLLGISWTLWMFWSSVLASFAPLSRLGTLVLLVLAWMDVETHLACLSGFLFIWIFTWSYPASPFWTWTGLLCFCLVWTGSRVSLLLPLAYVFCLWWTDLFCSWLILLDLWLYWPGLIMASLLMGFTYHWVDGLVLSVLLPICSALPALWYWSVLFLDWCSSLAPILVLVLSPMAAPGASLGFSPWMWTCSCLDELVHGLSPFSLTHSVDIWLYCHCLSFILGPVPEPASFLDSKECIYLAPWILWMCDKSSICWNGPFFHGFPFSFALFILWFLGISGSRLDTLDLLLNLYPPGPETSGHPNMYLNMDISYGCPLIIFGLYLFWHLCMLCSIGVGWAWIAGFGMPGWLLFAIYPWTGYV